MADYAFIVGIENYIENSLPKVPYAEADATEMAEALKHLGFEIDTLLLSKSATKTNIEHKLTALFETLTKNDRFLFYYAGHGFAEVGHSVLSSAETVSKAPSKTGVSLQWIMDELNETPCTKWMFFLDACHSGEIHLHNERSVVDTMSDAEIKQFFGEADHKVCFASCKFSEKSHSAIKIKHGIWTNQLLKALRGEEAAALLHGKFLTATTLQDYLNQTVRVVIKNLLTTNPKQTPVIYGAFSSNFEIADFTAIVNARRAASPDNTAFKDAEYVYTTNTPIKSLPGFEKRHTVPKEVNSYTRGFVERCAVPLVEEKIKLRFSKIKDYFGYLRAEITPYDDYIVTKDFVYRILVEQDEEDPGYANICEMLTDVSPEALVGEKLNEFFDTSFDEMRLSLPKKVRIEDIIDRIQGLKSSQITVDYDPNYASCDITVGGSGARLVVKEDTLTIYSVVKKSPHQLVNALKDMQGRVAQLAGPTAFMIG
jgi:hypothetical protein